MNSLTISTQNSKDVSARPLVAKFFTGTSGFARAVPGRFCSVITQCAGANPSYAMVGIPLKEAIGPGKWDQSGYVALRRTGPAGEIKLMARASCGYMEGSQSITLMNGWVVYHTHFLKQDSMVTAVFDDRAIMTFYTCFGRMTYEPDSSGSAGKHFFISNPSDALVFNKGGHGDCMDTPFGKRFAPGHRYGHLATGDYDPSDEPAEGHATSKTRKWTVKDILAYLRDMFYDTGNRPPLCQDFGLLDLPRKFIKWPKSLGNNIKENRTPRDLDLDGLDLLTALQKVVRYAGPYDIHLEPINEKESELKVIDFSPTPNAGTVLYHPSYINADLGACMNNACVVADGWVKESALGCVKGGVVNMGDAPVSELMASTDTDDASVAGGFLQTGWDTTLKSAFKLFVTTLGDDENAFNMATNKYPSVFSWYKLSNTKNPFKDSTWGNLAQSGSLRIRPHQVTSYNENETNPIGLVPREHIVEYKLTPEEYSGITDPAEQAKGYWRFAGRYDALQLSPCGRYVQIPALRDSFKTWYTYHDNGAGVNDAGTYQGEYMNAREIRIQLAAESNHCLVARQGKTDKDPTNTLHRIDAGAPEFTLQLRNKPMQYIWWGRTQYSWPIGRGGLTSTEILNLYGFGKTQFPRRETANNEVFADHIGDGNIENPKNRLDRHADIHVKNYKKVPYEGVLEIAMLTPVYKVGQQITYENGDPVAKIWGVIKCIVWNANTQGTKIEFGPNEPSAIWDGALQVSSFNNGPGASGGGTTTPKTSTTSTTTGNSTSTQYSETPPTQTSKPDTYSKPSGGQASAAASDNDSEANNQAINNNVTAAASGMGGDAGDGGKAGAAGDSGENLDDDEREVLEDQKAAASRGKEHVSFADAPKAEASARKSEIRGESFLSSQSELDREVGRSNKGIFAGESLKAKDDEMKFSGKYRNETGGNSASGEAYATDAKGGKIAAAKGPVNYDQRMSEHIKAEVARGFNPNGAASSGQSSRAAAVAKPVKPYESSASFMKRTSRKSGPETVGSLNSVNPIGGRDTFGLGR
jgi:hypothetical protein